MPPKKVIPKRLIKNKHPRNRNYIMHPIESEEEERNNEERNNEERNDEERNDEERNNEQNNNEQNNNEQNNNEENNNEQQNTEQNINPPIKEKDEQKADSDSDIDPMADLDVDAPAEYLCPITMSIMKDPVIMPDGQTYEREAIQKALSVNPVSPITREPMSFDQAKTNYALKSLIDKYIQDHISEIKEEPIIINPDNIVHEAPQTNSDIPVSTVTEIKLETFSMVYNSDSMLITVKPESIPGRLPVSIIAVIDTSGSMNSEASLNDSSEFENDSISRIQLVQYSLKTIISTLGPTDQITLIEFNNKATVKVAGLRLTTEGKETANKIIDHIKIAGATNLWDGINKGIKEAVKQQSKSMNTSIMVFTDGQPNIHPPLGLLSSLDCELEDINVFFSISTFGYGDSIDANLLEKISEKGNGIYGYCPDASMVGTIFINYISNLISEISPLNTLKVNQKEFNLILYNGSESHVMIPLDKKIKPEEYQINLSSKLTNQTFLVNEIKKLDENDENSMMIFRDQKYRKSLIDIISEIKDSIQLDELRNLILDLFEQLRNESNRSQFMKYLMLDLYNDDEQHGDIERACLKENFKKWGKNYLFSMLRFQILEQCGNFRDMSLQLYGNEIFVKFRKFGNKIFMNLPLPQKNIDEDDDDSSPPPRPKSKQMRKPMIRSKPNITKNSDDDDDDQTKSRSTVRTYKEANQSSNSNSSNDDNDNDNHLMRAPKKSARCLKKRTMRKYCKRKK